MVTLRPDLSWRGAGRIAVRTGAAVGLVAGMAVLATWSADGFLHRGGLERLISMKNTPPAEAAASSSSRGLDRGRLRAAITAAAQ